MKGLKLLLLTFATLAITACSDDTTDEWHGDFGSIQVPDTRQLSQKIPAGQTAGNSEIFFSTNDAWNSAITDESRAEAPTWVRINPDHGDAAGDYDIRVETDPNTAEESRTAFIEITCGTNSILITITQSGTDGEDTNEPDEPNIGEQVRYWQLHKIVGRDASGSLIAEMEYTYELPAEFSKECRITGFKISAAEQSPFNQVLDFLHGCVVLVAQLGLHLFINGAVVNSAGTVERLFNGFLDLVALIWFLLSGTFDDACRHGDVSLERMMTAHPRAWHKPGKS